MENVPLTVVQKLHKKEYFKKIQFFIIGVIIGFIMGVSIYVIKPKEKSEKEPIVTTIDNTIIEENYTLTISNVKEVLKSASDLISTKYYYTDADTYENYKELFGKRVPFTTDKVVFIYDGIISVGIDLADVDYEINNDNKVIVIILPEIKILSNEIDAESFEFPYMSDSVFNTTQMNDYTELIDKLKAEKAEELMDNSEFINEAMENTKGVLEQFLTASETTKEYMVIFK
jgi:hypothetical protein